MDLDEEQVGTNDPRSRRDFEEIDSGALELDSLLSVSFDVAVARRMVLNARGLRAGAASQATSIATLKNECDETPVTTSAGGFF